MGSQSEKKPELRTESFFRHSIRALRGAAAAIGGAAVVSSQAADGTIAQKLTEAERRRQRQREREDDDDRKRNDRDDDDGDGDGDDRLSALHALHASMRDRMSSPPRRVTSRQSADEDDATGGRRSAGSEVEDDRNGSVSVGRTRQEAAEADENGTDIAETIRSPQSVETETTAPESSTALRVGSGDTFASVDPETGTAIAESNGVRAIAGPEGAFVEGTPGGSSPPPSGDDSEDDGDTGDSGGGRRDDDGGDGDGGGDDGGGDNGDGFDS